MHTYQNQNYSWCDRVYVWVAFIFLIYNFAQDSVQSFQISNYLGLFNVHIGSESIGLFNVHIGSALVENARLL